jgi:hypothetical protein
MNYLQTAIACIQHLCIRMMSEVFAQWEPVIYQRLQNNSTSNVREHNVSNTA